MLWPCLLTCWAMLLAQAPGYPLSLDDVAERLAFLKDYFKIHVYVNPRPACALQAETCSLDEECCGGLECRMTASAERAIGSVCRPKVTDVIDEVTLEDPDTQEVGWNFGAGGEEEDDGSTAEEAQRERALLAKRRQEKGLTDAELVQELRRPLNADEMVSLRRVQEADQLRSERRLRELELWKRRKDEEDAEKDRDRTRMEALASERVDKVLREEQRQKTEMLRKMQDAARAAKG